MPSQSQKHSLSRFVETNDQKLLVNTIERSVPIKLINSPELSIEQKKQFENTLLEIVTRWKMNLGISNKSEEQKTTIELALVRDFIIDNYNHLTIEEIELAYILSLTDKLDDCEYFGYFSPLYCGKVLNSYLYYRKIQLADAIRRMESAKQMEEELKKKPTPEKEAELTIELFKDFYDQHKEGKQIKDVFNICWNYLRAQVKSGNKEFLNRWTNPKKEDYEEAIKYATNNFMDSIKLDPYGGHGIDEDWKENQIKKIARNYCVQKYFDEVDFRFIVKNIKPEHFS